jgi:hypothetical protein
MQNSALAIVLAKSLGADPVLYLPGALSATAHSCLGSGLATFWRMIDYKKNTTCQRRRNMNEYINESISQPFVNVISNCTTENKARGANESALMINYEILVNT